VHLTKLSVTAAVLLLIKVIGAIVAGVNGLVSCRGGCDYSDRSGVALIFHSGGTAMSPPWFLMVLVAVAILLSLRVDRWGLIGVLLLFFVGAGTVNTQLAEPISLWSVARPGTLPHALVAPYPYSIQLLVALIVLPHLIAAGATLVLAVWEFADRARNGWRRPQRGLLQS
jgi:hypothetical protein